MYLWLSYLPPCVRSLMATLSMDTLCFSMKQTQKIKNDLLTFPKWITCIDVLMTSLDFQPLLPKGVGAV